MKKSTTQIILVILISIILYFVSRQFYKGFMDLFSPDSEETAVYVENLKFFSKNADQISLVVALIPILSFLVWKITPITVAGKRAFSVLVIIACMLTGAFARKQFVKHAALSSESTYKYVNGVRLIPAGSLDFPNYLLIGLLAGSVASYLIYRPQGGSRVAKK